MLFFEPGTLPVFGTGFSTMTDDQFSREIARLRTPPATPVPQPLQVLMYGLGLIQAAKLEAIQAGWKERDQVLSEARRD
jgi:hypothetical protein